MENEIVNNDTCFNIQKKTGTILFLLTFPTASLNFINGLLNYGETPVQAFTNITVLPTLVSSFLLLITGFKNSIVLRFFQVFIIVFAGLASIILNAPGNLTGTLFLLLAMALAYQYGYFASLFYVKIISLLGTYMLITFANVFLMHQWKLPFGIPSILFSIAAIYLFWMVFNEEINTYLIRTNQLSIKLNQTSSENVKLRIITSDQAVLIDSTAAKLYNVEVIPEKGKDSSDPTLKAVGIKWVKKDNYEEEQKDEGSYILRTDRTDLSDEEIWNIYIMLGNIEYSWLTIKSYLGLRLNFHQKEDRVDTHMFISVLAYHILHIIEYRLRMNNDQRKWDTIRNVLSTHTRLTISFQEKNGNGELRKRTIRTCTKPEIEHMKIYDIFKLKGNISSVSSVY